MEKLRGLVVDDTIVYRKVLSRAVEDTGLCEVVQTAPNGAIALDWLAQKEFDVVLLDVFMPEMDGIETLKQIKQNFPGIEVIMISSDGTESVKNTVKALELGALEFVLKPTKGDQENNIKAITHMLKILFAQIQIKKMGKRKNNLNKRQMVSSRRNEDSTGEAAKPIASNLLRKTAEATNRKHHFDRADLILIAASTGGPVALDRMLSKIQQPLSVPLLIVQHMPKNFTLVLAQSLNQKSGLNIVEAGNNMVIEPGKAYIAAGGYHMIVEAEDGIKKCKLIETEYVNGVRPAADVLFDSISLQFKNQRILVVVLTGMGSDGTKGVIKMAEKNQLYTITQNEETCVVYGMPRSIDEAGLSDERLPLDQIADRIEAFGLRRR